MSRFFVLIFIFAGLPVVSVAQMLPGTDPLIVQITPKYPRPYDTITITPQSYSFSLAESKVTTLVDGVVIEEGTGSRPVTTQIGGPGTATVVEVVADRNGTVYRKQVVIRPGEVSLVTEPNSTAHPFYGGGTLVPSEGKVRLIAVADLRTAEGARIPSEKLSYMWKVGDRQLTADSGLGRSVLNAVAPVRHRSAEVEVTVSAPDQSAVGQARVTVSAVEPLVRVYRNDPLLGVLFEHALSGTISLVGEEDSFRAVPYYFGAGPTVLWKVNGTEQGAESDITLRSTGAGTGTATLGVTAKRDVLFESASRSFTVSFGESASNNFFGF